MAGSHRGFFVSGVAQFTAICALICGMATQTRAYDFQSWALWSSSAYPVGNGIITGGGIPTGPYALNVSGSSPAVWVSPYTDNSIQLGTMTLSLVPPPRRIRRSCLGSHLRFSTPDSMVITHSPRTPRCR
jgi:hypothetical protein